MPPARGELALALVIEWVWGKLADFSGCAEKTAARPSLAVSGANAALAGAGIGSKKSESRAGHYPAGL